MEFGVVVAPTSVVTAAWIMEPRVLNKAAGSYANSQTQPGASEIARAISSTQSTNQELAVLNSNAHKSGKHGF